MRNNSVLAVLVLLGIVTAGFSLPAPAGAKMVDEIAVVVDQESMTKGELEEAIQGFFLAQRLKPAQPGTPAYEAAKKEVVEGFIREVLLAEEADRGKIEVSDGEIDHEVNNEIENMKKGFPSEQDFNDELKKEGIALDDLRQDTHDKLLRRIKANRALRMKQQELPRAAVVSDEQVRQYFNEHPQDYEQVKFSIILFRVPPKSKPEYVKEVETQARGVLKELQGGADFAAYAKKYSEDQGSAEKGGAVGTVYRSELEPKLAKGIFSIPEKGLGIVRASDGFYIVKVDFKGKADYASVAPDIKEHLRKEKQDSGLKDWFADLKKNAYIVVDGKVVTFRPADEMPAETAKEGSAPLTTSSSETSKASSEAAKTDQASPAGASDEPKGSTKTTVYPSLPSGDSFTLYFSGQGFFYGTQDLAGFYPSGTNVAQSFPFGYGLNVGLDWSVDPTFQVGVVGEILRKWVETVKGSDQWTGAAVGPALSAKLIIPLDESTNFILSAVGGYYFLSGSTANVSGTLSNLNGSNFGWRAGGELEFLLDTQKNSAFDLGGGYRYLNFTATGTTGANGPPTLDFSGPYVDLGFKFYLGKD